MVKLPQSEEEVRRTSMDRKSPDLSLEWTDDLRIEIKVCGQDVGLEQQEFLELFPHVSENLLSADCIDNLRLENQSRRKPGHTLTDILEQDLEVNSRKPDVASPSNEEKEEKKEPSASDCKTEKENKKTSKQPEDKYGMKNLITLPSGEKKCHICGKVFSDSSRIRRHLMSHSEKKPYSCHLCGWGFYQKCNMDRHMTSHSKEGEGEPCPHCNNWFTTKSVLSLHMRDAHNDRLLTKKEVEINMNRMRRQMEEQKRMAEQEAKYARHQKLLQLQQAKYQKEQLQKQQAKQDVMVRQMNKIASLTCNLCKKTFVKKTNLKHHMMLHRGEKPWKCNICEWRFVQKCNLKKHMESHVTGAYACPACNVKFSSKTSCTTHLYRAHKDNYNKLQESIAQLSQGKEESQEEEEVATPNKGSSSASNSWWKHIGGSASKPEATNLQAALGKARTEPGQPLTCKKCGKMFLTAAHLSKHMLIHNSGVKPYACPVCGCRFHLVHNMKRHIQTHEEQGDIEHGTADGLVKAAEATASSPRPSTQANLKCNICNKWFSNATRLGQHMVVHDRDKPHVCSICGWRFKQHQNLKRHMHTHTGIKPFTCDFCDKGYTDAYTLKMHISKAHPDVASSLPSLQLNPKPLGKGEDAGFNSMLNEMQRKEQAVHAYQAQFIKSINKNELEMEGNHEEDEENLILEPDIDLLTPAEEMLVEEDEEEDAEMEIDQQQQQLDSSDPLDIVEHIEEAAVGDDDDDNDGEAIEDVAGGGDENDEEAIDVDAVDEDEDESVDIREILNMEEDEDEEIIEEFAPTTTTIPDNKLANFETSSSETEEKSASVEKAAEPTISEEHVAVEGTTEPQLEDDSAATNAIEKSDAESDLHGSQPSDGTIEGLTAEESKAAVLMETDESQVEVDPSEFQASDDDIRSDASEPETTMHLEGEAEAISKQDESCKQPASPKTGKTSEINENVEEKDVSGESVEAEEVLTDSAETEEVINGDETKTDNSDEI